MGDVTSISLGVQWAFAGMLFVFGSCIGSFLNVVIYRLPLGLSIVSPPSRCPECKKQLRATDNIPIVGWLVLRGRCRNCAAPISARYPLVELSTAVIFARIGWMALNDDTSGAYLELSIALWLSLALRFAIACCLVVVGCWDWDRVRMPVGFMRFVFAIFAAHVFMSASDIVHRLSVIALASWLAVTVCFVQSRFHRQLNWRSILLVAVLGGMLGSWTSIGLAIIMATSVQFVSALPVLARNTSAFRLGWPALAAGGTLVFVMLPGSLPNALTYPWLDAIGATVIVAMLSMLTQVVAGRQSSSHREPDMPAKRPEEARWTEN